MTTTKMLGTLAISALLSISVSCKGEKKNETEATEAVPEATTANADAKFKVDPATSTIKWTGSKPTGEHTGTIALESGVVKVSNNQIASGSFLIDMNSITVTDLDGDEKTSLEGHLKGNAEGKEDHFFNVDKFPTAAFEITSVEPNGAKANINGNLTIRGVKKNISFPATANISDTSMTLTSEPFTINRTDWGVNYGSKSIFDNLGDKFIDDDMQIQISLQGSKM